MMEEEGMDDQNAPETFYEGGQDPVPNEAPEVLVELAETQEAAASDDEAFGTEPMDLGSEDPGDYDTALSDSGGLVVDPMGVMSTDLDEDEGDLLSRLFTDRRAESEEKKEEDEKGAEAEAAKTIQEDVEEKAKDDKKATDRKPQPKKASAGVKSLGGVAKEATSEVNELAALWESAPDVSRFF